MKKKLLIFQLLLAICTGCASDKKKSNEPEYTLSLNETKSALVDTAFFQSVTVIPLEANDSSLIRSVDRIYKMDGVYYLFDHSLCKVFMYNERGNYLGQISDIGNGPGEYVQISDMAIDRKRKNIVLLCDRPYKVMYYTLKGKFLKEISNSDYYDESVVNDGNIYCYKRGHKGDDRLLTYTYPFTFQGDEVLYERPFFHTKSVGEEYLFTNGNYLTVSDAVYLTRPFENNIYTIDENGVHGKYTIDFKKHNLPLSLLEEGLSPKKFLATCGENKYVCGITNVIGNCDYLLFSTNIGLYVYDKQLQQLNGYSFILNSGWNGGSSNCLPVGNSSSIAQVIQSIQFKMYMDIRHKHAKDSAEIAPVYESVYTKLQDEDNPVLIVYELPCKK